MQRILVLLIVNALAVLVASALFGPKVRVESTEAAVIFALVLALLNTLLRPILFLLTLPLNLLTLGLFTLVLNALLFWIATLVPVGVRVDGFVGALLGALTLSVVNLLVGRLVRER